MLGQPYRAVNARIQKYQTLHPRGQTSVYVVQQRIYLPCLWHYAVLVDAPNGNRRDTHICDHGPVRGNRINKIFEGEFILHKMPATPKSVDDIRSFSGSLPADYWLLLRDCRHHTVDVLDYIYGPHDEATQATQATQA